MKYLSFFIAAGEGSTEEISFKLSCTQMNKIGIYVSH